MHYILLPIEIYLPAISKKAMTNIRYNELKLVTIFNNVVILFLTLLIDVTTLD